MQNAGLDAGKWLEAIFTGPYMDEKQILERGMAGELYVRHYVIDLGGQSLLIHRNRESQSQAQVTLDLITTALLPAMATAPRDGSYELVELTGIPACGANGCCSVRKEMRISAI
jgi:hypothetical protein